MILGNFGVSNIGDELILESTIKKIKDKDLVITCPFPKVIQKKWKIKSINLPPLGIRSSFKIWRWFIFINELRKSEILLVAGGGLLRDGYSFWLWSVPLWLAILLRKSIYWQSADFTGVKKPINKKLLSSF